MSQKSYNNTPTLFLIPTPIGNLDDITLRSIKTLNDVEVIFCEDTRVTGLLLAHLKIKKKLIANHEHNEAKNKVKLLEYLGNGYNVGLVSDRGTPIISDPGYNLAREAIEKNYNVVSIPGATALIPALTSSGLNPQPFLFYGFLNSKDGKQKKELETLKKYPFTFIIYESPHRIVKTLENMENILGNRTISISREITKKFEEIYRGTIDEVKIELGDPRGEFVIVIDGNTEVITYDNISVNEHVNTYVKEGKSVMDAIKQVAKDRNVNKNIIYSEYHKEG